MSTAVATPAFTAEFASTYRDMMLGRIEKEQKTTRRVIDAITRNQCDYRHEPKGRTALELASHLVQSEIWFLNGIADGKFEWKGEPEVPKSVDDVLAYYDQNFAPAIARARKISADRLLEVVDFFGWKQPNFTYIQFCQDHTVHHRAQLSTYLRCMGGKVPDIYGGSADEPFQG